MCLYTKWRVPRISLKRIPIYKIAYKDSDNNYRTPVKNAFIKYGLNKAMGPMDISYSKNDKRALIGGGFIHSYMCIEIASVLCYESQYIFEGYIPKFSLYFKGHDFCVGEICSNRVIYEASYTREEFYNKYITKLGNRQNNDIGNE